MICWYCHYGWPSQVVDIYERYAPLAGESAMHYGAAHIVWDDENFARHHVQWCLDHFDEYKRDDATDAENAAVRDSLEALLALPDDVLDPGSAYESQDDDASIEDFPPPAGMVMRRHRRI